MCVLIAWLSVNVRKEKTKLTIFQISGSQNGLWAPVIFKKILSDFSESLKGQNYFYSKLSLFFFTVLTFALIVNKQ